MFISVLKEGEVGFSGTLSKSSIVTIFELNKFLASTNFFCSTDFNNSPSNFPPGKVDNEAFLSFFSVLLARATGWNKLTFGCMSGNTNEGTETLVLCIFVFTVPNLYLYVYKIPEKPVASLSTFGFPFVINSSKNLSKFLNCSTKSDKYKSPRGVVNTFRKFSTARLMFSFCPRMAKFKLSSKSVNAVLNLLVGISDTFLYPDNC